MLLEQMLWLGFRLHFRYWRPIWTGCRKSWKNRDWKTENCPASYTPTTTTWTASTNTETQNSSLDHGPSRKIQTIHALMDSLSLPQMDSLSLAQRDSLYLLRAWRMRLPRNLRTTTSSFSWVRTVPARKCGSLSTPLNINGTWKRRSPNCKRNPPLDDVDWKVWARFWFFVAQIIFHVFSILLEAISTCLGLVNTREGIFWIDFCKDQFQKYMK